MSELFPVLRKAPAFGLRTLTAPWRALRWFGRSTWRALRWLGRGLRRRARALLYGLIALVAIHLAAVVVTGLMLSKEMARQKAAGVLLTKDQLIPRLPAGAENAATLHQKAFDALRLSDQDVERFLSAAAEPPTAADAMSPQWRAEARIVVAANAESLRWARRAAQLPHCVFPVKWKGTIAEQLFPHPSRLRTISQVLELDAALAAAEGRVDAALADAGVMLRMAEHLKTEPSMISQMVAYSIQGNAVRTIRTSLSFGAPSVPTARDLMRQLAATNQVKPSTGAIRGEITFLAVPYFDMARHGSHDIGAVLSVMDPGDRAQFWPRLLLRSYGTVGRPLLNLDERTYLRGMGAQFDAFTRPWPESQRRAQQLQAQRESRPVYVAPLTRALTPIFERAIWSRDKATANLGDARIALALAIYKSQHGTYPDSLAVLERDGAKLPRDPFGGEPYRYRREGAGYVVYSIGSDMRDDGGVPPVWDTDEPLSEQERLARGEHYDLPLRVPR